MDENTPKRGLDPDEAAALLGKLMLAWDGQWFLKVAESCGLDKAVELNARVRASFGRIEVREYFKALGISSARSVREAVELLGRLQESLSGPGDERELGSQRGRSPGEGFPLSPAGGRRKSRPEARHALCGVRVGVGGLVGDGIAWHFVEHGDPRLHGARRRLVRDCFEKKPLAIGYW